jgi:hypothetical protein
MYKNISTLLLSFFVITIAFAQNGKYSIATIPDSLLKNVSSVKREKICELEIKAIDKAIYKVTNTTTYLNESAKNDLVFLQYTDKFHSLEKASIEVYNDKGILQKKYSKSDLNKQATGEGLVPDGKMYYLPIAVANFPVTVKFEYEIKYKGILNYPSFEIQTPNESVEQAVFSATVPLDLDIRYKAKNIIATPQISTDDKQKKYTWSFSKLNSFIYEPGAVSRSDRYPQIILAPNKFELDDYAGDMSTWQSFGNWYGSLANGTNNLTEATKQYLQKLVQPFSTDKQKIKAIYTYLQNNFRYVSIQLGIGGFKPFDADFVDKKKYGDCKALSNYTQSCLQAIGIKSYQALINAGHNEAPVDVDFPANQFNHVILCVPQQKDTIWLECTSSTADFGTLGSFTENRNALLITENGGVLVATPKSNAQNNQYNSNTVVTLNGNGSGKANISLTVTGEYKQDLFYNFINQKYDEQKKYLVDELNFIEPYDFSLLQKANEPVQINAEYEKLYDFIAGKKMFINARIYKLWQNPLPAIKERKQDYYLQHPFLINDTTIYNLPVELSVETLPRSIYIKNELGIFTTSYTYNESKKILSTTAFLLFYQNKIPANKYAVAKQFFDGVMTEYNEKIVLKKL